MSIPSQGGVVSFALQTGKVGTGTFDPSPLSYYKFRAPRAVLGTIQNQQTFPLELGGTIVPTGAYKSGHFFGGEVDVIPRIEKSLGFILKATMGAATTIANKDSDLNAVTGVYTHIFRHNPTNAFDQPWCSVRRLIPGATTPQNFGETGYDCKINSVRLTVPGSGKIAARVQMVGRDAVLDDGSTWTYANASFEDSLSTPDAGRGSFKIGGVTYPIVGMSVDVINGLSSPQQEMVIGSFTPDDFVALSRAIQFRLVYKYEDSGLYRKLLTGQANGTTWSPLPLLVDTVGNNYALDVTFQAPALIGVTVRPYTLRLRANRIALAVDGPVELQAGDIITQTFIGTVLEPAAGDYFQIILENGFSTGY